MSVLKKICPYPFSRFNLSSDALDYSPCCSSWLTDEFKAIPPGKDPWNGPAAQILRKSILDGSYRYCRTEYCQKPVVELNQQPVKFYGETPISNSNWQAIKFNEIIMPEGPSALTITADLRCNLSCPSCRKKSILTIDQTEELYLQHLKGLIQDYSKSLMTIKIANGEAFFSPWLREIIKNLNNGEQLTINDLSDNDFHFELRQKGVDMRIGIDIATLALKKQVDTIVLFSGDGDFIPAAKLARIEGVRFILDIMGQKVSNNLLEHVDIITSSFSTDSVNSILNKNEWVK